LQVNEQLPEAFSLLGYAFYLQPLIMPIIREMPEGREGRQVLTSAVHSSLLGEWGAARQSLACPVVISVEAGCTCDVRSVVVVGKRSAFLPTSHVLLCLLLCV
jgi:hypothetical protein